MALPIILIDSATGSDTAASGAGPATALTGSAASTSGDGLTVTLDGSPSLTNVATDGSHVIYLADTTAGARNFGKITGKDDGAKTVTVNLAFGLSLTNKSWAIGGKRAALTSSTTKKLYDNNGGAGDMAAGWILQLASGHSETGVTTTQTFRRAGDATDGPVVLRGESGYTTLPLLRWNANVSGLTLGVDYIFIQDLDLQNSSATITSADAIVLSNGISNVLIQGVKAADQTNNWRNGIIFNSNNHAPITIIGCNLGWCTTSGITATNQPTIAYNYIHDGTAVGIIASNGPHNIIGNIIARNGAAGVRCPTGAVGSCICWNTFDANTGSHVDIEDVAVGAEQFSIINNILSNGLAYGINFSGGWDLTDVKSVALALIGNVFYNNSSGDSSITSLIASHGTNNVSGINPDYQDAANGNFTPRNFALLGKAYPVGGTIPVGVASSTYSYATPGAVQFNANTIVKRRRKVR